MALERFSTYWRFRSCWHIFSLFMKKSINFRCCGDYYCQEQAQSVARTGPTILMMASLVFTLACFHHKCYRNTTGVDGEVESETAMPLSYVVQFLRTEKIDRSLSVLTKPNVRFSKKLEKFGQFRFDRTQKANPKKIPNNKSEPKRVPELTPARIPTTPRLFRQRHVARSVFSMNRNFFAMN